MVICGLDVRKGEKCTLGGQPKEGKKHPELCATNQQTKKNEIKSNITGGDSVKLLKADRALGTDGGDDVVPGLGQVQRGSRSSADQEDFVALVDKGGSCGCHCCVDCAIRVEGMSVGGGE